MFGFLNVYKPVGKTSHDVVSVLRRVTKIKQIGHTGTLDPFAEGVLPICIGKATRLIEYLSDDKAYIATVQLGISTDTYDIEGEIVKKSDKKVSVEEIESALSKYRGEIEQYPPKYSAIKVNGKKLYEYARAGLEVEIKPRKVSITELKIFDFDEKKQILKLYIACSKGTYIRSIANDLGEDLDTGAHLIKLVRVKAGEFKLENSVKLEKLSTIEDVDKNIIEPLNYLSFPKYPIKDDEKIKISNGNPIGINAENGIIILTYENKIAAIGEVKNNIFKCQKVFL